MTHRRMRAGLFALAAGIVANGASAGDFNGTWQLQSGEYVNEKKQLVTYDSLKLKSLKVITGEHFSFVTMAADTFWSAGAGTYQFDTQQYTESPTYNSFGVKPGETFSFRYKREGELWYNSRWDGDTRVEYEVWKRIDK